MRRPSSSLLTKLLLSCTTGLIGCGNNGSNNYSSIVPANPEEEAVHVEMDTNSICYWVDGGVERNRLEQAAANAADAIIRQAEESIISTISPISFSELEDFLTESERTNEFEVFVKTEDGEWTKNITDGVCPNKSVQVGFTVPKSEKNLEIDDFYFNVSTSSISSSHAAYYEVSCADETYNNEPPDFMLYRSPLSVESLDYATGVSSSNPLDRTYFFQVGNDQATAFIDAQCDGSPISPPWTSDEDETDIQPGNYSGTIQCDYSIEELNGDITSDRASFEYGIEVNSHGLPLTTDGQVPRRGGHSSLDLGDVVIEAEVTSAEYSSSSATIESTVSMDFGDEILEGEQSEVVRTTSDSDVVSYHNSSAYRSQSLSEVYELRLSCSGNLTRQ